MWLSLLFLAYIVVIWGFINSYIISCVLTALVILLSLVLYKYCEEIYLNTHEQAFEDLEKEYQEKFLQQERLIENYKKENTLLAQIANLTSVNNNSEK